jgi:hypothetical protein
MRRAVPAGTVPDSDLNQPSALAVSSNYSTPAPSPSNGWICKAHKAVRYGTTYNEYPAVCFTESEGRICWCSPQFFPPNSASIDDGGILQHMLSYENCSLGPATRTSITDGRYYLSRQDMAGRRPAPPLTTGMRMSTIQSGCNKNLIDLGVNGCSGNCSGFCTLMWVGLTIGGIR